MIAEYLDFYEDEGVQHIAVATDDIISTVSQLKARGVEFLPPPPQAYYDDIPRRIMLESDSTKEIIDELDKNCQIFSNDNYTAIVFQIDFTF